MTHMEIHNKMMEKNMEQPPTQNIFLCDECEDVFTSRQLLGIHKESDHYKNLMGTEKEGFTCKFCEYVFINEHLLKEHNKNKHNDVRIIEFKCNQCQDDFIDKTDLDIHIRHEHSGDTGHVDMKFVCHVCKVTRNTKHKLNKHMKIHGDDDSEDWNCNNCPFQSTDKKSIINQ